MRHWNAPLDPDCPAVRQFMTSLFDDPMTAAIGAPTGDIVEGYTATHRRNCKRCQEYGAANIEVTE